MTSKLPTHTKRFADLSTQPSSLNYLIIKGQNQVGALRSLVKTTQSMVKEIQYVSKNLMEASKNIAKDPVVLPDLEKLVARQADFFFSLDKNLNAMNNIVSILDRSQQKPRQKQATAGSFHSSPRHTKLKITQKAPTPVSPRINLTLKNDRKIRSRLASTRLPQTRSIIRSELGIPASPTRFSEKKIKFPDSICSASRVSLKLVDSYNYSANFNRILEGFYSRLVGRVDNLDRSLNKVTPKIIKYIQNQSLNHQGRGQLHQMFQNPRQQISNIKKFIFSIFSDEPKKVDLYVQDLIKKQAKTIKRLNRSLKQTRESQEISRKSISSHRSPNKFNCRESIEPIGQLHSVPSLLELEMSITRYQKANMRTLKSIKNLSNYNIKIRKAIQLEHVDLDIRQGIINKKIIQKTEKEDFETIASNCMLDTNNGSVINN